MKLGRIVGTVVSTRKDPSLDSLKLLIVETSRLIWVARVVTSWQWTASARGWAKSSSTRPAARRA